MKLAIGQRGLKAIKLVVSPASSFFTLDPNVDYPEAKG